MCHNRRIKQHRVFEGVAQRGHTSVDWFFGFKLHLIINDCGKILACSVTTGNTDNHKPTPKLMSQTQNLFGKKVRDKGYLSQALTQELLECYMVQLVTKLRKNMKAKLMDEMDS